MKPLLTASECVKVFQIKRVYKKVRTPHITENEIKTTSVSPNQKKSLGIFIWKMVHHCLLIVVNFYYTMGGVAGP